MKGMIYTELLEFVEERYGFDVADNMIELSHLPNNGAYTQGGNYPYTELVTLVSNLSTVVDIPIDDLIETYARHLFSKIVALVPFIVKGFDSPLKFIAKVDDFIHPAVQKLYPDADLPHFECISLNDGELVMDYSSNKPLASFGKGLMLGCADYFKQPIEVRYDIVQSEPIMKARFYVSLT